VKKRLGEHEALLPAERKLLDEIVASVDEPRALESGVDGMAATGLLEAEGVGEEFKELAHTHVLINSGNVGKIADHRAHAEGIGSDIVGGDAGLPGVYWLQGGEYLEQGGLSSTVRSHQPHKFSGLNVEREVVKTAAAAEDPP
jgi:hypothetical protein